jgi:LysR family transcriptional regulator for bpeEF and oprC
MAVSWLHRRARRRSSKTAFDLAIHSGDLPDSNLVARRIAQTMTILVATPQYLTRRGAPDSPDDLNRLQAVVLVERGSVRPWTFGSGQNAKRVIPIGVFRTSDIEQMRMGVGSSPQNSEKVLFYVF